VPNVPTAATPCRGSSSAPAPGSTPPCAAGFAHAIRTELSPRHVPDDIVAAPAVPRTLTGKKLETPIKRILQGTPPAQVTSPGAITDEHVLNWYAGYGRNPAT
jgi:hypothetical protein